MSEVSQLREEVAGLRQEVAELREENAQTRLLAAFADRDAAAVRAGQAGILAALNALRETQVEHGQVLTEHARVLAVLVQGQRRTEEVLGRHAAQLDGLIVAVGALADRQEALAEQQATLADRQDAMAQRQDAMAQQLVTLADRQEEQGRALTEIRSEQDRQSGMLAEILRRLPGQ